FELNLINKTISNNMGLKKSNPTNENSISKSRLIMYL
ncbi:MAG: hypothetical protein RIQ33_1422, partial [Bacteroidota bacterium]